MNLSRNRRNRLISLLVWLGSGLASLAGPVPQTIPFSNNFEYAAGTSLQSKTNEGWDASDFSVQVQTNVVCADTSSVVLPQNTALTNFVVPAAMTNVWTDFYVQMEAHNDTNDATATSNAVIQVAMDWPGYLQVYDRTNGWLTLSNTVRGAPVAAFTNGQWGRVTLFQNYASQQCAVFLNGTLIRELLPFGSNVTACSRFRAEGGDRASSYLDNYSVTRAIPAGLTDAQEIDAYGYVAMTFNVGPGQTYTTIQSALDAALSRYTINVANGTYNENVTSTHSVIITGGVFSINGTLTFASGLTTTSLVGFAVGDITVSDGSVLTVMGSINASNVVTGTGAVLTVSGSMTNLNMTLGTNSTVTIGQGLSGSNLTLQAGAHLDVTGSVNIVGTVNINTSATLTVNGQVIGHDVIVNGVLALGAGDGITATNLTLGSSVTLNITNANVVVSNLSINAGARLVVVNGSVVANGLTFTGSFTLDENWANPSAASVLPYEDNFDSYQVGVSLNVLGSHGWGASDNSIVVENARYFSASNGVDIGFYKTLSNRVDAAGAAQVWTDLRVIPTYDVNDQTTAVETTAAFMAVMSTNGYMSLYNRTNALWEVCTNDIWQHPVARQTGQWSRVSVLCDYNTKQCAVFLDGTLLRQGFPFINPALKSNSVVSLVNEETNRVCLDNVYMGATYPSTLTNDVNGNGIPDAMEVLVTDDILRAGSIFKIR